MTREDVIKDRIRVSVAAWAYESNREPIMEDSKYDKLATKVDRDRNHKTGNELLDEFFRIEFSSYTGMWVWKHPDLKGIISIYLKHFAPDAKMENHHRW